MLTVDDVARYFLVAQDQDETAGERISNLKLQKLCYYAQGFHLAIHGQPLFAEPIQAWRDGPVIESLWRKYRDWRYHPLPIPDGVDLDAYEPQVASLLDDVAADYGQFAAAKLRDMTHETPPYIEARRRGLNTVITTEAMRAYSREVLASQQVDPGETPVPEQIVRAARSVVSAVNSGGFDLDGVAHGAVLPPPRA